MAALEPYRLGPLPVAGLNAALELELDEGDVVMSINAHNHARRRHPVEFATYFPQLASVIANPLYARDDFRNDGKIELVGKPVPNLEFLLVAVTVEKDAFGRYNVVSFYPISEKKVANRRESGHLKRVVPKN